MKQLKRKILLFWNTYIIRKKHKQDEYIYEE